jgi:hypothetical protein
VPHRYAPRPFGGALGAGDATIVADGAAVVIGAAGNGLIGSVVGSWAVVSITRGLRVL